MTEEEYFRKNYPDSCYGDKPLSPYWDFFQDGVEFRERESEKKIVELEESLGKLQKSTFNMIDEKNNRIADLEKANAELKAKNKWYSEQVCNKECAEVWGNLTKAKEIIKNLMVYVPVDLKEYEEANNLLKENSTYERIQKAKYNYTD